MKNIEHLANNLYLSEQNGMNEILFAYQKKSGIKHEVIKYDANNGFTFRQNGKWGYINFKLQQILEPIYDNEIFFEYYYVFNNQYAKAVVSLNGKKGVVDRNGKLIIGYGLIDEFDVCNHYFIMFKRNGKYGVYNNQGELILKPEYGGHDVTKISKSGIPVTEQHRDIRIRESDIDLLIATKDDREYIYNFKGEVLVCADSIKYTGYGKFEITNNNIIDVWQYPYALPGFKPERNFECSVFKEKRMYGVKNKNGEIIIPNIFSKISMSNELQVIRCAYYHDNNYMFFDFEGNEITDDNLIIEYCDTTWPPHYCQ